MNEKGGSVALYDAVFEWHLEHLSTTTSVSANGLHKELVERYNLEPIMPFEVNLELPFSKETVHLACHNAKAMTIDLLTDPRLRDEDFLFNDGDPMAGIPEEFETVGDVNTGLSYRET